MTEVGRRTDRLLDALLSPEDLLRQDRPRHAGRRIFNHDPRSGIFDQNYTFGTPVVTIIRRKVSFKTKSGVVTRTVKFKVDSIRRAITCAPTDLCDTSARSTSSRTARRTRESESTSPSRRPAPRSTERFSAAEPDVSAGTEWRQVS
jgi:hypothetical protein